MKDISLNFGAIKDSISRLSSLELIRENDSKTLKQFINTIKSSPVLNKQQLIYKNFENVKHFEKERLAERFISQNISLFNDISWDQIIKENRDLRLSLLSNSHVEANGSKNTKLYESIHTLIEAATRKGYTNINKEQEAYEFLLSFLTTKEAINENVNSEKNDHPNLKKSWNFITKLAVSNFNDRYSHLNESEKSIFHILTSDNDKKINYIEDLKAENKKLIGSLIERTSKDDNEKISILESFKNKLDNIKELDNSKLDEYILSCFELKETLEELK